jgi:hypothetical protein
VIFQNEMNGFNSLVVSRSYSNTLPVFIEKFIEKCDAQPLAGSPHQVFADKQQLHLAYVGNDHKTIRHIYVDKGSVIRHIAQRNYSINWESM